MVFISMVGGVAKLVADVTLYSISEELVYILWSYSISKCKRKLPLMSKHRFVDYFGSFFISFLRITPGVY